jgi:hypothetical protein
MVELDFALVFETELERLLGDLLWSGHGIYTYLTVQMKATRGK